MQDNHFNKEVDYCSCGSCIVVERDKTLYCYGCNKKIKKECV